MWRARLFTENNFGCQIDRRAVNGIAEWPAADSKLTGSARPRCLVTAAVSQAYYLADVIRDVFVTSYVTSLCWFRLQPVAIHTPSSSNYRDRSAAPTNQKLPVGLDAAVARSKIWGEHLSYPFPSLKSSPSFCPPLSPLFSFPFFTRAQGPLFRASKIFHIF